jgi:hypothetical protein
MWTYLFALFHFGSEWLIFKTAKLGGAVISPFIVASEYSYKYQTLISLITT